MDPLRDYFDAIQDAPVPERLMAETPPETFMRKLATNAAWAMAGIVLVLIVSALPTPTNRKVAERVADQVGYRVAVSR